MKKIIALITLTGAMFFNTGCVSNLSNNSVTSLESSSTQDYITDNALPDCDSLPAPPISFKDTEELVSCVNNHDLRSYPEQFQDDYSRMFDRIIKDGYIMRISSTADRTSGEKITLCNDISVYLFPYAEYEDIGVSYYVSYNDTTYQILIYYSDSSVISESRGISEYLEKRLGLKVNKETAIDGKTVSLTSIGASNDAKRLCANSFIDDEHYCTVRTTASEEQLTDFLRIFKFDIEKVDLTS